MMTDMMNLSALLWLAGVISAIINSSFTPAKELSRTGKFYLISAAPCIILLAFHMIGEWKNGVLPAENAVGAMLFVLFIALSGLYARDPGKAPKQPS